MLNGEMLLNLRGLSDAIPLSHHLLLFLLPKVGMCVFSQKAGKF